MAYFTSLITNAIKFTERGSISVKILNHRSVKRVSVAVSDTGIGISEKDLSRIFEPFYQVGLSSSHSGTGLGLSFVKKSVELLKREIEVTSRPDRGSTFKISLPYDLTSQ